MSKTLQKLAGLSLAAGLAVGFAAPAGAQLITHRDLSLAAALTIANTAMETCRAQGYNVSVHVLGREGQILVAMRNPLAGINTFENSMKKAYTSKTFRVPSGDFVERVGKDPNAQQFFLTNFVPTRGALPIKDGMDTMGAVGVSGAPGGDKDEACAQAGISKADLR